MSFTINTNITNIKIYENNSAAQVEKKLSRSFNFGPSIIKPEEIETTFTIAKRKFAESTESSPSNSPSNSPIKTRKFLPEKETDHKFSNIKSRMRHGGNPKFDGKSTSKLDFTTDETGKRGVLVHTGSPILKQDGNVLISEKQELHLEYLGEGKFHKVWNVKEDPSIVIKTWKGSINPRQIKDANTKTLLGFNALKERANTRKDIGVAELYTKDRTDFEVWDYISGDHPTFEQVKQLLINMIINPSLFIPDFRRPNLIWNNDQVTSIDPWAEDKGWQSELPINLSIFIKSWFTNEAESVDKTGLQKAIEEFDGIFTEGTAGWDCWIQTRENLKAFL